MSEPPRLGRDSRYLLSPAERGHRQNWRCVPLALAVRKSLDPVAVAGGTKKAYIIKVSESTAQELSVLIGYETKIDVR